MAAVNRASAEVLLKEFSPRMGADYARYRNFDLGPGQHRHVSCLSPFIRRRLLLEQDVVAAAISAHGAAASEKFVQEVFWRSYFKGWLELRPTVWRDYITGLQSDLHQIETDALLKRRVTVAEEGRTGIDCFDAWVHELITTGYLHNHARMWFASIWIFTLRLPWRIGADFLYRHLLDGDPASNTLSWRWVAGLHTRGKPYAAEAWNITKFTQERFTPSDRDLAANVVGLQDTEPDGLPPITPLVVLPATDPAKPTLFLITEEDCRPEDFRGLNINIRSVVSLTASRLRSTRPVSESVVHFEQQALSDAAARFTSEQVVALEPEALSDLVELARQAGVGQIVTPYIPHGPLRDAIGKITPSLSAAGVSIVYLRRQWDEQIWPHATAGFFKVKQQIPTIVHQMDIWL
jgi:deoxyribodipyrimidine photo-lyase